MTVWLSADQVIRIHAEQVCDAPLLFPDRLDLALNAPLQGGFGAPEFYPSIAAKGAKLLEGISRAQAFGDGNKRTAWLSFLAMLNLNGHDVRYIEAIEVSEAIEVVARHEQDDEGMLRWVNGLLVSGEA